MFVPRSVRHKPDQKKKAKTRIEVPKDDPSSDEEEDFVVEFSRDQRWPAPDEPACIVCGKYGQYICDATDEDVCSQQCKERHLRMRKEIENDEEKKKKEKEEEENTESEIKPSVPDLPFGLYKYREDESVREMNQVQLDLLRTKLDIRVHGDGVPKPITDFSQCHFHPTMYTNMKLLGLETPTPIQMQVIPSALKHRDVLASAPTGSGKTASFLLPIVASLTGHGCVIDKPHLPRALILSPTRELCMQIEDQAKILMKGLPLMKTALIVGGFPMPPQLHRLKQGVQVVIATPGRLLELCNREGIDFSCIRVLVLDEVDALLEMGFENQIQRISSWLPAAHQTLLFSATVPQKTEDLASQMLKNSISISTGNSNSPSSGIKHTVLWVEEKSKKKRLFELLRDPNYFKPPTIVFVDSKIGADLLAEAIEKKCGIATTSIHGDKSQAERALNLKAIQEGKASIIVSTSLLGRGLDLAQISQIIHFDMPRKIEEYIHQAGRSSRLGSSGWAITFINNNSRYLFLDVVESLSKSASLPSQLLASPHLRRQMRARERGFSPSSASKRTKKDELITRENLMEFLTRRKRRRRLRGN
ncbi:probable ATP-dependent RNA helicase DDX59 isoform X2 [Oscarella lobularis]|uniref:probable ATP-dependent RNA helicase DDX59 isoform X2 n=1 Tax=Oscarella lobularis TaxID=121494 RepID=UPI0033137283